MDNAAFWLTEQDVVELIGLDDAIGALEHSVVAETRGEARNMSKTMLQYGKSNLHALGGQLRELVGTKTWVHAEAGTCPLLMLWDAHDGRLRAVIEAFALGNLRTGATSGLATRWLAAPQARVMAMIGTGKQALSQVAAVAAVRTLDEVRVFGRDAEKREAFAAKVKSELGVAASPIASIEDATRNADVVTLATRASEPFLFSRHLKDGAHVNAIGAIGPDREEFGQDLFDRASIVCVDQISAVQQLSREFGRQYQDRGWDDVRTLGQVVAQGVPAWNPGRVSLFKAMGMGLSDVALGAHV
ncbi:MAG: ornithine cyclodeaminase family protein, partial [Burkholderiales bacterium]